MRKVGMIRNLDDIGRIVIPVSLRRSLGIKAGDRINVILEAGKIVMEKYAERCFICGHTEANITVQDKLICKQCLAKLLNGARAMKS